MQVILEPLLPSEGGSITIETNDRAVLSSLISTYCAQKGIEYSRKIAIYDERKRPLPLYSTLSTLGIENAQVLLIGKEGTYSVFKQWPMVIAFAALGIGLIGIITMSMVYGLKGGEYFDDYGVVMDAGSSKTNTIVYKWRSGKHRGTGRVTQAADCFAKGGIAKMNPMHLEPVIDCAKNVTSVIAEDVIPKTPLFFAATAGMRLLNLTNAKRVEEILAQLKIQLPQTNLNVTTIEVISGRDEGIYGWITANFLQKTLELPQKVNPWLPTTYGSLDMGGASIQISYAIPERTVNRTDDVLSIKLYGQLFNVFAHSNLCFGREEAHNRYLSLLLSEITRTNVIQDPCAPKDYSMNVTYAELFKPICAQYKLNSSKYIDQNFTYVGTSDPSACQKNVARLLDEGLCKTLEFKECFKNLTDIPQTQKYLAFATFYYTTHFLNITDTTLENYEKIMEDFCKKDLYEIQMLNNTHGLEYCFNAQYIHQVLTKGFGFNKDTWKNVEFVGKISGKDVGWTLGYMISATNRIPEKATPRLISTVALTVSLILFILIIVATAIFLLWTYKKNSSDSCLEC